MTDFSDLIEGVLARQTRSNLVEFLGRYELIEFGRKRQLDTGEKTMILTAVDRFLLDDSFAKLGFTEFADLTGNLASVASMNDGQIGQRCDLIRRCSFDAMASLKAFEARLCRGLDQAQIRDDRRHQHRSFANDL